MNPIHRWNESASVRECGIDTWQAAVTLKQKAQKRNFDQMLQNGVPGADGAPAELVEHRAKLRKNEVEGVRKWTKVQQARSAVVACSAEALIASLHYNAS